MSQQQPQEQLRPLYFDFGERHLLLPHLPETAFSPALRNQFYTFLHLVSTGDVRLNRPSLPEICSYQLQNVLRWWQSPDPTPTPRFRTENQSFHSSEEEDELAPIFTTHFGEEGSTPATVFKLAGIPEFQTRYILYLRANRDAMLARQTYMDNFLPKQVSSNILDSIPSNTPFEYLVHVYRLCVTSNSRDLTRSHNEVLIDATSFRQIAMQLEKNIDPEASRTTIRSAEGIQHYSIVYLMHFKSLGFDFLRSLKQTKNPQYSTRPITPFSTQQNNTLPNLILGSISYRPENLTESDNFTGLSRCFEGPDNQSSKAHSTRVQLNEDFNMPFFDACNTHANHSPIGVINTYKDGVLYVTLYPNDCYVKVPPLLWYQLVENNQAYEYTMPRADEIELFALEKVSSSSSRFPSLSSTSR